MTDIVERLNKFAVHADPDSQSAAIMTAEWRKDVLIACRDAIAEIMRLRTQVEQMQGIIGVAALGPSFAEIREQAKAQDRVDTETRR